MNHQLTAVGLLVLSLIPQIALLLAYLAVMLFALANNRRFPRPCLFLGWGCALLLVTAAAHLTIVFFLLESSIQPNPLALWTAYILAALTNLTGFILVVKAVFADRRATSDEWPRDRKEAPPRATRGAPTVDPTGIQEGRPRPTPVVNQAHQFTRAWKPFTVIKR